MADDSAGKSIADAYRNWTDDSAPAAAPSTAASASDGASIADAYRTLDAGTTTTQEMPAIGGPPRGGAPNVGQIARSGGPSPGQPTVEDLLQPAPNTMYGNILPIARDLTTGEDRLAMPNMLRAPLLDIFSGVGAATTADPETGKIQYGLSPGAGALAGFAATPLRFSGAVPLEFVPPAGTFDRRPPIPPDAAANLLSPDARVRATEPPAGPTTSTGVPVTPSTPTVPPPATPSIGAAPRVSATATTSAEALPVATALLTKARASGADLTPDYTNKFIDKVTADATPAGPGTAAVAGPNDPVASMVQRLQALRDQPLNIQDVMGMDQELNARQRAAIKTDPDLARRIGNLQDSLRDQVDAATEANVGGGADGWKAFQDGRAAYSQYKKMQAVEDMKERADGMTNPTSSYKTAVNNFVNGPKARGWSDDEKASLVDSAERGVLGGTLHLLGQRLIPLVAGGVGLSKYGAIGGLATMVGSHYAGDVLRNWGNALQTGRVNRTLEGLGSSIQPPNALQQAPSP